MRLYVLALFCLQLPAIPTQAQWDLQDSHTTANLRGIVNVGGGVAWASGTNGTVLRTEDGGYLWQICTTPAGAEHLDFRGIQAFDANTSIVMSTGKGDLSRLYKTTDGCHSWKLIFKNPDKDGFWDAVQFADEKIGWLLGDPTHGQFQVWETNNGGKTWIREAKSKALAADPKTSGAFAASNSSLTVSTSPEFGSGGVGGPNVYAIDQVTVCLDDCNEPPRDHWRKIKVPIAGGSESAGIFSLASGSVSFRLAVGGDYTKPDESTATAAFSADGGEHWTAAQTPPHGYRSAVAYEPSTKTWITVGPNGTDISADDGRNWRPLHPNAALHETPDADRNWNALSLPYAVGPHGRIGKLRNDALKP